MHRNPRHYIPHHTPGCIEHNGCTSSCAVRAFVEKYWNLYDAALKAAKPVHVPFLEDTYGV